MSPPRYPRLLVWLHWSMAVALLTMVFVGLVMVGLPRGHAAGGWMMNVHLALGLALFVAALVRLRCRLHHEHPAPPESYRPWERRLAGTVHVLFYLLMLGMPVAGFTVWLLDPYLGPNLFAEDAVWPGNVAARLHLVHYLGAWLLLALVAIHFLGAVRGQFSRDPVRRVLARMR